MGPRARRGHRAGSRRLGGGRSGARGVCSPAAAETASPSSRPALGHRGTAPLPQHVGALLPRRERHRVSSASAASPACRRQWPPPRAGLVLILVNGQPPLVRAAFPGSPRPAQAHGRPGDGPVLHPQPGVASGLSFVRVKWFTPCVFKNTISQHVYAQTKDCFIFIGFNQIFKK